MIAVGYQTGGQGLVSQLRPDGVLESVELCKDSVSKVSGEGGTGFHGAVDLLSCCTGVSDGYSYAPGDCMPYQLLGAVCLGTDRDVLKKSACMLKPAVEFPDIRIPYISQVVGAPRAVQTGDVIAFDVDSGDAAAYELVFLCSFHDYV